jgi:hypothetical protein
MAGIAETPLPYNALLEEMNIFASMLSKISLTEDDLQQLIVFLKVSVR